jgi:hypothetical protein
MRTFDEARSLWQSRLIGDGSRPGAAWYLRVVEPLDRQGKWANWEAENHYDPLLVLRQVKALVPDDPRVDRAIDVARSQWLRAVQAWSGSPRPYRVWTHGLRRDFEATGNSDCRDAALLLSNRVCGRDNASVLEVSTWQGARTVAFALQSHLDARALGQPRRPFTKGLLAFALDVIDQQTIPGYWQGTEFHRADWFGVRSFMLGLVMRSLIHYHDEIEANPAIVPKVRQAADWLWEHAWNAEAMAFPYWDRDTSAFVAAGANPDTFDGAGQPKPAPELNPFIGPAYAWLATVCEPADRAAYVARYEHVFIGSGMAGGFNGLDQLATQKEFNQALFWEPEGLAWRDKALALIEAERSEPEPDPDPPRPTRHDAWLKLREAVDLFLRIEGGG